MYAKPAPKIDASNHFQFVHSVWKLVQEQGVWLGGTVVVAAVVIELSYRSFSNVFFSGVHD